MGDRGCSDTGPILHLKEVESISLLKLFSQIFISVIVKEELFRYNVKSLPKNIKINEINNDQVILLSRKYDLDIGESSILWLCRALGIPLILTDDLNAREVASDLEIKVVGTIGIITRCFREKIISKEKAVTILKKIHDNSSLFITAELINYVTKEIKQFKN